MKREHEIRAVRHEGGGIVWADEAQAEVFGVYEEQADGTYQWVADCVDRDTARRVASALTNPTDLDEDDQSIGGPL